MFKSVRTSVFALSASAVFLSLYAQYLPFFVSILFLVLGGLLLLSGIVAFALHPKQFFRGFAYTEDVLGMVFLPLSLVLFTYRLSLEAFLTKPYAPYFLGFTFLLLAAILAGFLLLAFSPTAQPKGNGKLFAAFALLTLPSLPLYLMKTFGIENLPEVLVYAYVALLFLFFIPSFFWSFLSKTSLSNKAHLSAFFPAIFLLLLRFGPMQSQAVLSLLWMFLSFFSLLLALVLSSFDRAIPEEEKANLSPLFPLFLWSFISFKEEFLLLPFTRTLTENTVLAFLPYAFLFIEYLLLFLSFMVFAQNLAGQFLRKKKRM